MLTFAEQTLLLLLDDEREDFLPIGKYTLTRTLAGSVLLDLAMANRIDTDLESLFVVDSTPTGNSVLDSVLKRLADSTTGISTITWIEILSEELGNRIRECALENLVERGLVKVREGRKLWFSRSQRYSKIDLRADRETKLRIMNVLFSEEIPDPHDIGLVCLAEACGILRTIFSEGELQRIRPRIKQIQKMELIGRELLEQLAVWKLGYRRRTIVQVLHKKARMAR